MCQYLSTHKIGSKDGKSYNSWPIRFELLRPSFERCCNTYLNIDPPPLPHMKNNRTPEDRHRAMSYFGAAEIAAVRNNWRKEVDLWGYTWDNARK